MKKIIYRFGKFLMQTKAAWYISVRCDYNLFFSDTYNSPQHGYEYVGKSQNGNIHHTFCPDDLEKKYWKDWINGKPPGQAIRAVFAANFRPDFVEQSSIFTFEKLRNNN